MGKGASFFQSQLFFQRRWGGCEDSFLERSCTLTSMGAIFCKWGKERLFRGDASSGLRFFDRALECDGANAKLLFQQGLVLFKYGSMGREELLPLAGKRFKMAVALDADRPEIWHAWGNVLYFLGMYRREPDYFSHARAKYERALALSSRAYAKLAELHWDRGDLWLAFAERSQEAIDLRLALESYDKASSYRDRLPVEFWLNFGRGYVELGEKVNAPDLLIRGVVCYKNGILEDVTSSEGWLQIASALHSLYSLTREEGYCMQANECFAVGARLCSRDVRIWCAWASLLLESGRHFGDREKVYACIEKCKKGYRLHRCRNQILSIWAEALAHLGKLTGRFSFFCEAGDLMQSAGEENPELLYSSGICLLELGSYFQDADFYYRAIEKFQEGLSLDRSRPRYAFWFALGRSYLAAAILDCDPTGFERASKFFERALRLRATSLHRFHYALSLQKLGECLHHRGYLEKAIDHFERALNQQKNALYVYPDWLVEYATSLDALGAFDEDSNRYRKAIDLLRRVLALHPDFPEIHYRIALVQTHYALFAIEPEILEGASHHYRIAHKRDPENDRIVLDWGIALFHLAQLMENARKSHRYLWESERKMVMAARLGNAFAYYSLACFYSMAKGYARAMFFLKKAYAFKGLPLLEDLLEEEWLAPLREVEDFQLFLETVTRHTKTRDDSS